MPRWSGKSSRGPSLKRAGTVIVGYELAIRAKLAKSYLGQCVLKLHVRSTASEFITYHAFLLSIRVEPVYGKRAGFVRYPDVRSRQYKLRPRGAAASYELESATS